MKKILSYVLVFTLGLSLACGVVYAQQGWQSLSAEYANIRITIDNNILTPKDVNGKLVEPFIIDGTTYVPVRAISEALGKTVTWNGDQDWVQISTPLSAWTSDEKVQSVDNYLSQFSDFTNFLILPMQAVSDSSPNDYLLEFTATLTASGASHYNLVGVNAGDKVFTQTFVTFERDSNGNPICTNSDKNFQLFSLMPIK